MNTSAMTRVILMKIPLKMQIIHAPLTVKGTPVCSSLQKGLPLTDPTEPGLSA